MVSVMDVDMAGALLLATHERADALGVPPEQRVYPRGWCYARDPVLVAEHPDLGRSPAMAAAAAEAFRVAGLGIDDVGYLDLYSCFASSLHFARDALGLAAGDPRGLTVTGGLPYHGGPASGYLTHSIAAIVEKLRANRDSAGLVSGVGMHMTKHVFGVYSTTPGPIAGPSSVAPAEVVPIVDQHVGDSVGTGQQVGIRPGRAVLADEARPIGAMPGDHVVEQCGRAVEPVGVGELREREEQIGPLVGRRQVVAAEGVDVRRREQAHGRHAIALS